jgi:hypothetical protein
MQGGRVIDAIPQIADGMARALQRADDAFFLLGIDFDK